MEHLENFTLAKLLNLSPQLYRCLLGDNITCVGLSCDYHCKTWKTSKITEKLLFTFIHLYYAL